MRSIVHRTIGNSNRKRAFWGLLWLIVLIGGIIYFSRYLNNFVRGPFELSGSELASITNADMHHEYFITVNADDSFDTGYSLYEGDKVVASYGGMRFGDRYLLVRVGKDFGKTEVKLSYTGELVNMPPDVRNEVLNPFVSQYPDLQGKFLPCMLDTKRNFREIGYVGIVIAVGLFFVSGNFLSSSIAGTLDHKQHNIMRSLARFGTDVDRVVAHVEHELQQPDHKKHSTQMHTTRSWLVSKTDTEFQAMLFKDIVWYYLKVTTHRRNFIVTGREYEIFVYDQHGEELIIRCKKKETEDLLNVIERRAPWALGGFSKDLSSIWNKQRSQLIATVAQRREKYRVR